jgi:NTP pyrophosphatase (non-canonical NTP hydrolase)
MPCDVDKLIRQIVEFRDKRNWAQFHNPKDLALGLSIEAAELNELFLWKKPEEANPARVREELADAGFQIDSPPHFQNHSPPCTPACVTG